MPPLDTKAYLLKRYSCSDSFWTFFPESASYFNQFKAIILNIAHLKHLGHKTLFISFNI